MRKLLGHVGVDSGQVMVGDPCYLERYKANEFSAEEGDTAVTGEFSYDGVCRTTCYTELQGGQLGRSDAVACSSGYGDGRYPVYAEYKDGRVARLVVEFMEAGDDEEGA